MTKKTTDHFAAMRAACGDDETRPHLHEPFAARIFDRDYTVATDGHRLHAIREAWTGRTHELAPAEGFRKMIESYADTCAQLGEVDAEALTYHVAQFPRRWDLRLQLCPGREHVLRAVLECTTKRPRLDLLGDGALVGLGFDLQPEAAVRGFDLRYLADAVTLAATHSVMLWGSLEEALSPIMFTPYMQHPREAERLALVMPMRL